MIAIDTNILVYAHRRDMPLHARAMTAVTECAEGSQLWALPWPVAHEFLAVVTNPRVYKHPSTLADALMQLRAWCDAPTSVMLAEGDAYFETLAQVLSASQVVGGKVHYARIASLCIEHGVKELWTADRAFSRFGALRTRNPLVS